MPAPPRAAMPRNAWAILDRAAARWPAKPAVVQGGTARTYAQLHRRSRAAAAFLASKGVGHGDRIAFISANSPEALEVHFAASWLGATLVNVNIHLAPPELAYILEDSRTSCVVAQPEFGGKLVAALEAMAPAAVAGLRCAVWAGLSSWRSW